MNFLLSDDLVEFRKTLAQFFSEKFPEPNRFLLTDGERSESQVASLRPIWQEFVALGALSAPLPESQGGVGFGLLSGAVVLEEAGAVLAPLPILEVMSFFLSPVRVSTEANSEQIENVVSGALIPSGSWHQYNASIGYVSSSEWASHLVSSEAKAGGLQIIENVKTDRVETIDLVRSFSVDKVDKANLKSVGSISKEGWSQLISEVQVLLVAELCGVTRRILEMTTEYVKTRKQFDVSIGTFQAIQHKLSDLLVAVESATALCRFAAWCGDSSKEQFYTAALAAKSFSGSELVRGIENALQAHGGIGFTFEYPLHLYLRRAHSLANLLGSSGDSALELGEYVLSQGRLP